MHKPINYLFNQKKGHTGRLIQTAAYILTTRGQQTIIHRNNTLLRLNTAAALYINWYLKHHLIIMVEN